VRLARVAVSSRSFSEPAHQLIDPGQCDHRQESEMSILMMPDDVVASFGDLAVFS